jgi:hypothetical protein
MSFPLEYHLIFLECDHFLHLIKLEIVNKFVNIIASKKYCNIANNKTKTIASLVQDYQLDGYQEIQSMLA